MEAIKGNLKTTIPALDIQDLERLANIFHQAAMKVSNRNVTCLRVPEAVQPPRVETLSPRVQDVMDSPRVLTRNQWVRAHIDTRVATTDRTMDRHTSYHNTVMMNPATARV